MCPPVTDVFIPEKSAKFLPHEGERVKCNLVCFDGGCEGNLFSYFPLPRRPHSQFFTKCWILNGKSNGGVKGTKTWGKARLTRNFMEYLVSVKLLWKLKRGRGLAALNSPLACIFYVCQRCTLAQAASCQCTALCSPSRDKFLNGNFAYRSLPLRSLLRVLFFLQV